MEEKDILDIASLHLACWKQAYRGILSDTYLDSLTIEDFKTIWHKILGNPRRTNLVYVPCENSSEEHTSDEKHEAVKTRKYQTNPKPLGYVCFGPAESTFGEIYGIYVHPDRWGSGIAATLISNALTALQNEGYRTIVLWTMRDNNRARRFYEKNGFTATGNERMSERGGESFPEVEYRLDISD